MRDYDVRGMPAAELERTRRELAASLALARPGSPVRAPIEAHMSAIDAELAERARYSLRFCGCGYGTDSDARMDGHLWNNPGHEERDLSPYQDGDIAIATDRALSDACHWPVCKITVNGQTYCDEGRNCNG